jgi:hypothetical protein
MRLFNRVFPVLVLGAMVVWAADPALAGPLSAPGPVAGVGLPIVAIGYGAYWLVKRYRRKTD